MSKPDVHDLDWEEILEWHEAGTIHGGYVIITDKRELWYQSSRFSHWDEFEEVRTMLARGDVDGLKGVAADHHQSIVASALRSRT